MAHQNKISRRTWLVSAAAALAAATAAAQSRPYPNRPVRVIVFGPAGSSTDVTSRLITQKLSDMWKQPVVIDNRAGAGGILAAQLAATSAPNGYTYHYTVNSVLCANPHLYRKLPYDALNSFDPVSLTVRLGYLLVAGTQSPIDSLRKLIEYAKSNPGKLNYSSSGMGAGNHVAMELLTSMLGLHMTHIPMQDSATGIISNTVDLAMVPYTNGVPLVRGRRARALGVTRATRLDSLPEVPTIGETVPGFVADVWHGLFAPAGTPAEMVHKVSADIASVLRMPDLHGRLANLGLFSVGLPEKEFGQVIRNDYDKWGKVISRAGIKLD